MYLGILWDAECDEYMEVKYGKTKYYYADEDVVKICYLNNKLLL